MRAAAACLLLLPLAAAEGDRTVRNEEFNFSIRCPDSVDWEVMKIEAKEGVSTKAHFRTYFADTEPLAEVSVELLVSGVPAIYDRLSLKKVVDNWSEGYQGHLTGVRDRTESEGKLGGEDCVDVDLKGEGGEGTHHRTWTLARMGKFFYILLVDRKHAAVGNEDVEAEVKQARDSFQFLRKETPGTEKGASGEAPPPAGGGMKKKEPKKGPDPELLKQEKIVDDFWRFMCVKPAGFVKAPLRDDDKKSHVVARLIAESEEGQSVTIYIFAATASSAHYTLEQLKASYVKTFLGDAKESGKILEEEDNYKGIPLAKNAIMWYAVKVLKATVKERWIVADCKNDRQYQIRIYGVAGGENVYKKHIEEFLKSFKPFEK